MKEQVDKDYKQLMYKAKHETNPKEVKKLLMEVF